MRVAIKETGKQMLSRDAKGKKLDRRRLIVLAEHKITCCWTEKLVADCWDWDAMIQLALTDIQCAFVARRRLIDLARERRRRFSSPFLSRQPWSWASHSRRPGHLAELYGPCSLANKIMRTSVLPQGGSHCTVGTATLLRAQIWNRKYISFPVHV